MIRSKRFPVGKERLLMEELARERAHTQKYRTILAIVKEKLPDQAQWIEELEQTAFPGIDTPEGAWDEMEDLPF